MQIETDHSNHTSTGQPLWLAPVLIVRAIIAALCRLLFLRDRMKSHRRTTRFKPTWRDHFDDLRLCEWNRARMRALGIAQLLADQPLDFSGFTEDAEAPDSFGGPCPKSPFEMNRRFLSLATFSLDIASDIQRHAQRLARRERVDLSGCPLRHAASQRATSPALRAEGENHRSLSSSDAKRRGRWLAASSRRDGGGSRRLLRIAAPRAPPAIPQLQTSKPQRPERLRSPPHARIPPHSRAKTFTPRRALTMLRTPA